ncbi:DDE-type integrase/transposase/recombinase [Rhodobacteraceae bacterium IMCC1335]
MTLFHCRYVTKRQGRKAALVFLKKIMKRYGSPHQIVTDRLKSYRAAMKVIGNQAVQDVGGRKKKVTGRWANNRVKNSHLPFRRRERAMLRFRRMHSLQKFASVHASFHNHFNSQRSLSKRSTFKRNRDAALNEWRSLLIS